MVLVGLDEGHNYNPSCLDGLVISIILDLNLFSVVSRLSNTFEAIINHRDDYAIQILIQEKNDPCCHSVGLIHEQISLISPWAAWTALAGSHVNHCPG